MNVEFLNFIDLNLGQLKMVLEWRNHPEVRKWMNTSEPISLERHLQFIASLREDKKRACYLVKDASRNIGVIQLNDIQGQNVLDFALYANPELLKGGAGMRLAFYGVQYSFNDLNFESLSVMTYRKNQVLLKLWSIFGIKTVSETKGGLVHGRLYRNNFLVRPQNFKDFISSV